MNAYCCKCKAVKPMSKVILGALKGGQKVASGICGACYTPMYRAVPRDAKETPQ